MSGDLSPAALMCRVFFMKAGDTVWSCIFILGLCSTGLVGGGGGETHPHTQMKLVLWNRVPYKQPRGEGDLQTHRYSDPGVTICIAGFPTDVVSLRAYDLLY